MRNATRKILSVIMAATMVITPMNVCASAEAPTEQVATISPRYSIAISAGSYLSISGNTATCTSNATGESTTSGITCTQTLEKKAGLIYYSVSGASWYGSTSSKTITMSNSKSGLGSGTYRLKSVYTFTRTGGEKETFTVYSTEKTV